MSEERCGSKLGRARCVLQAGHAGLHSGWYAALVDIGVGPAILEDASRAQAVVEAAWRLFEPDGPLISEALLSLRSELDRMSA